MTKRISGLSLIELVITISMVAVLSIIGSVAVARVKNTQALKSSSQHLAMLITRAKNLALAPPADETGYRSYGVGVDVTQGRYSLIKQSSAGVTETMEGYALESGVNFSAITGLVNSQIYFGILENGKVNNLTGDAEITLTKGADSKKIKISYPYGAVEIR